jgi:hypothetical protein
MVSLKGLTPEERRAYDQAYQKAYREKHRARLRAQSAEYSRQHREARAKYLKGYKKRLPAEKRAAYNATSKAYAARVRERDPEWFRFTCLISKHGLTLDQYHAILERQDFGCAICGDDVVSCGTRQTHVDHDHETGKVRGILCGKCNTGLGKLGDGKHLDAAVRYIARSRKKAA